MAAIRSAGEIGEKWGRVTPERAQDFANGVQNPRKDWGQSTLAASDSWKAGVQGAITKGSFAKGVQRAGTPGWQSATLAKGVDRWGPGVALAKDKFVAAIQPYVDAIKSVQLPPRYARRDPRNLLRVTAIVQALVAKKESLG